MLDRAAADRVAFAERAVASILTKGSDEQKAKYLPNMVAGKWTGTMNLTEPHCGTDLGLLKTRADPNPDGTYAITGTKIFISSPTSQPVAPS